MAAKPLPSADYLRECFVYDPDTGALRWRTDRPREHFQTTNGYRKWLLYYAGNGAGHIHLTNGYATVTISGQSYKIHRIIWKMQTGNEPPAEIDHRNGDQGDNRWDNMRAATRPQNMWNAARGMPGKTLPKGVFINVYKGRQSGKFFARAYRNGMRFHLGSFETAEEADAAYRSFTERTDGEFHRSD